MSGRCCRCNRTGTCRNCVCKKAGKSCFSCLPGKLGKCSNHSTLCNVGRGKACPSSAPAQLTSLQRDSAGVKQSVTQRRSSPAPASSLLHRPLSLGKEATLGHSISASQPSSVTSVTSSCQSSPNSPTTLTVNSLPSMDSIFAVRLSTLQHVPKGARDSWAALLAELCSSICQDPSNLCAWQKLFMLPRCILANPTRGGRTQWRVTQELVKSRIRSWLAGDFAQLWEDVLAEHERYAHKILKKTISPESLRKANAQRARRAVEDVQYRKAIQALSSSGLARVTPEILEQMLDKHPNSPPPPIPPGTPPPPPEISHQDVLRALKSFPSGSSPGPSGLRANHLKEAVLCPSPDHAAKATRALSEVVRLLAAGHSPQAVVSHLCGAILLARQKKGGGLRPIAVGEVLRRLTSKCLSRAVQDQAISSLTPLQVGVGVKVGCEAIVHSVAHVLEEPTIPPDNRWTLLLDFSNAFNSVHRGCMFEEIRTRIPSLAPWMESCYGAQPILHMGDNQILSRCGVQQGDPLGPLGFALTLQPIVEKIKAEVPSLKINAWYLDNGTLCGSPTDLAAALRIVEQEGPSRGLKLNRAKSLVYIPDGGDPSNNLLPSDIPITKNGFTLLGCPIGPFPFCDSIFSKRVEKVKQSIARLPDLQDSQMEMALLRSCLALPKVSFSLRSCPPVYIKQGTAEWDNTMRDALSDLAGGPLSDWGWLKASLPSSCGGLNIRSASLHAPAAYISSTTQSRNLVNRILGCDHHVSSHLASSISSLAEAAAKPEWISLEEIDIPLRQRPLSYCIDEAVYLRLLTSAPNIRSRALALSTSLPHSGDWLNVVPSASLGLHLQDKEFRLCLSYWLGLRMSEEGVTCPICQKPADAYGDHQVGCGGNGDRIYRHNSIRDAVFSAAQSAALAPRKEAPSVIPGSSSRPADVYLPNWNRGRPAALDVHVISTMQQQTLVGASITPGHALHVGEERKMAAHASTCRAASIAFIPLVVETLGGWSQEAISAIKSIGRLQGQRLGIPPPETTRHLFQRLAIALWKGNASLWIRRQPARPSTVDGNV